MSELCDASTCPNCGAPCYCANKLRALLTALEQLQISHDIWKITCEAHRVVIGDYEEKVAALEQRERELREGYVKVSDLKAFRKVIGLHIAISPLDSYAEGVVDAYFACDNQINKFIAEAELRAALNEGKP